MPNDGATVFFIILIGVAAAILIGVIMEGKDDTKKLHNSIHHRVRNGNHGNQNQRGAGKKRGTENASR